VCVCVCVCVYTCVCVYSSILVTWLLLAKSREARKRIRLANSMIIITCKKRRSTGHTHTYIDREQHP